MYRFTLSTDSTCDLYHDFLVENEIKCAPLSFHLIEKDGSMTEYSDAFTEYSEYVAFYEKLKNGYTPKTAMLNYEAHYNHFRALAEGGAKDVLHFCISSGLARTHEVAKQAAADVKKEFPECNVLVCDPLTATAGQGALVQFALECRNKGMTAKEAYDFCIGLRLHIQHFIVADDLGYLKRGGRISAVAAAIGGMLDIKPIITFDKEGKLYVRDKVRGIRKAVSYIKRKMEIEPPDEHKKVYIVHTGNEAAANELADFVRTRFGIEPHFQIMGPVIGAHVGPNSFSLGYITKRERNEY